MVVVLDTHALIWLDQDDPALGAVARRQIDTALKANRLAVSSISFWETAMLVAKRRLAMAIPVAAWRRDFLRSGVPGGLRLGMPLRSRWRTQRVQV